MKKILAFILVLISLYMVYTLIFNPVTDVVEQGTYHHPTTDQVVALNGQWVLYPDVLIDPTEPNAFAPYEQYAEPITVPSSLPAAKKEMVMATYRLQTTVATDGFYALRTGDIRYANRTYMNGELVGQSGVPSTERAHYKASSKKYVGVNKSDNKKIDIVIQVANYDYPTTGIVQAPIFGNYQAITRYTTLHTAFEVMLAVGFFVIGLFYMRVFSRNKHAYAIYFGLYATTLAFYQTLLGERLFEVVTGELPLMTLTAIQLSTFVLASLFFYRFITLLYPTTLSLGWQRATYLVGGVGLLWHLSFIVQPLLPFNIPSVVMQIVLLLLMLFIYSQLLYVSTQIIRRQDTNSPYILLATIAFALYITALGLNLFFETQLPFAQLSLLVMIVCFATLITSRYHETEQHLHQRTQDLLVQDQLKDAFLQKTASELQQPVKAADLLVNQLVEGELGPVVKEQQHHLLAIQNAHRQIAQVTMKLQNASQATDKVANQPTAITMATVVTWLEEMDYLYHKPEVALNIAIDQQLPAIFMDSYRFEQVIFQIIDNALRYTAQGSITVTCEKVGSRIRLTITDTGCGIEATHIPLIFTAFYQVLPSTKQLGLGLTTAQQFVKQAGGDIIVTSTVGKGTSVQLELPIANTWPSKTYQIKQLPQCSYVIPGETTLLIAAKEASLLQSIVHQLQPLGYRIFGVTSAIDALAVLKMHTVDMAIIDVGITTKHPILATIRQHYDLVQLPILLLTSTTVMTREAREAFQINDCLVKPVSTEQLHAKIALFLAIRQTATEASRKELRYYIAQISPHFLYNTMNTLIGLSYEKPEQVSEGLMHLTTYFRAKLDFFTKQELVPLEDEMDLVRAYLAIEQLRFGERLAITIEDTATQQAYIPTLVLQTLVENSIVHGILKRKEGGHLHIRIEDIDDNVRITINDNGIGMSTAQLEQVCAAKVCNEVGIANTMHRIHLVEHATIAIDSTKDVGTTIIISLRSEK